MGYHRISPWITRRPCFGPGSWSCNLCVFAWFLLLNLPALACCLPSSVTADFFVFDDHIIFCRTSYLTQLMLRSPSTWEGTIWIASYRLRIMCSGSPSRIPYHDVNGLTWCLCFRIFVLCFHLNGLIVNPCSLHPFRCMSGFWIPLGSLLEWWDSMFWTYVLVMLPLRFSLISLA